MWKRQIDGRSLTFHLAGINNQNFLMRDEETGSFWQQISGKAVSGPLRGKQLELVHSDELTFSLWRGENPTGNVLRPLSEFSSEYEEKDWDVKMKKVPTVVSTKRTGIKARELMFGVEAGGASKAYPVDRILKEKLIQDRIGSEPVLVVTGSDGKSIRVYSARLADGTVPDFYRRPDSVGAAFLMDSETGSSWNFQGCAVEGKATDQCLEPIPALKDYWFDWQIYHPETSVYGK